MKGAEPGEPFTQRWIHYGTIKSTSSNAMIQDISEGLMRKNCVSRNKGEKNCLILCVNGDMIGDGESKQSHLCKYQ